LIFCIVRKSNEILLGAYPSCPFQNVSSNFWYWSQVTVVHINLKLPYLSLYSASNFESSITRFDIGSIIIESSIKFSLYSIQISCSCIWVVPRCSVARWMLYSSCDNSLSPNDFWRLQLEYWVCNLGVQVHWDWETTNWNMCSYKFIVLVDLRIRAEIVASVLRPYNLSWTYKLNETGE